MKGQTEPEVTQYKSATPYRQLENTISPQNGPLVVFKEEEKAPQAKQS